MRMRVCVFDGKRNWEYSLSFVTGKWKTFFESKLFQVIQEGGMGGEERREGSFQRGIIGTIRGEVGIKKNFMDIE